MSILFISQMPLSEDQIDEAVARYSREYDRYVKLAELVYQRCQEILDRMSVRATVQRRAKAPHSLRKKLLTMMSKPEKAERFNKPDDVFHVLSDLAGVRVTTYLESDREKIVREIEKEFSGPEEAEAPEVEVKDGKAANPHYRATHCQVRILDDELPENAWNLKGTSCEIQVCSLLAHVWNEIEHDLKYKPDSSGDLGTTEVDLLNQLALLTQAGDISIRQLLGATDDRLAKREGEFLDVHDFVARMRDDFPTSTNFGDNAGQLLDELQRLGLSTPEKIKDELFGIDRQVDRSKVAETSKSFQAYLKGQGENASVDETSSDALLMLLLQKRAKEIIEAHPFGPGKGRPSRLVYLARRFDEWQRSEQQPTSPKSHGSEHSP